MIYLRLPFFPPSANTAYFTKGSRRILTSAGKKFKNEVKTYLVRHYPEELRFITKNGGYDLLFVLYFDAIYNKGWPEKSKTRHKRVDATNRVKLLEDALVEAAGHDDCQHTSVSVMKKEVVDSDWTPWCEIYVWSAGDGPLSTY